MWPFRRMRKMGPPNPRPKPRPRNWTRKGGHNEAPSTPRPAKPARGWQRAADGRCFFEGCEGQAVVSVTVPLKDDQGNYLRVQVCQGCKDKARFALHFLPGRIVEDMAASAHKFKVAGQRRTLGRST